MRVHRDRPTVFLLAVLLCGLTACLKWPAEQNSAHPDQVLFEQALFAVEQNRFAVANLTLQTLINTYPDSESASRAAVVLRDPRIAKCGESWNSAPDCQPAPVAVSSE
jgi:outer membrane protein assembly factor BamD (BamD/ComL family)